MAFKADAKKQGSEKTSREEEDDAGDALPANVAGMVVVPSATVKALELDKAARRRRRRRRRATKNSESRATRRLTRSARRAPC